MSTWFGDRSGVTKLLFWTSGSAHDLSERHLGADAGRTPIKPIFAFFQNIGCLRSIKMFAEQPMTSASRLRASHAPRPRMMFGFLAATLMSGARLAVTASMSMFRLSPPKMNRGGEALRLTSSPRCFPGRVSRLGKKSFGIPLRQLAVAALPQGRSLGGKRYSPAREVEGSTGFEPLRSSKCSCGEATLPLWPDKAMVWPRLTASPRLTFSEPLLA